MLLRLHLLSTLIRALVRAAHAADDEDELAAVAGVDADPRVGHLDLVVEGQPLTGR